ncbi:Uncharacterized membrane protein [Pilibacter termitis]|uniref:Uncharacterized membrane protein n=1 Tax=Pilibacter termitis TaxID=263852 RepID=A0A1T4PL70_9ENTE|nr:TMEM175 family protein [Pilibacter termitis]SJZ92323.1 Uncharacterized membrane protein [Pilibacter termitis]
MKWNEERREERERKFKERFLESFPGENDGTIEEKWQKFQGQIKKREKSRRRRLREHLEVFTDAIVAIIITVMVLEIPIPEESSYAAFLKAIGIFLISFFIVANFWYEQHKMFADIEELNERILLLDMLFIAGLCLIPLFTKWMMSEVTSFSVMNYGVVYLIVNASLDRMSHLIMREHFVNDEKRGKVFQIYSLSHFLLLVGLNISILLFAFYHPKIAHWLYITLPIASFVLGTRNSNRERESFVHDFSREKKEGGV